MTETINKLAAYYKAMAVAMHETSARPEEIAKLAVTAYIEDSRALGDSYVRKERHYAHTADTAPLQATMPYTQAETQVDSHKTEDMQPLIKWTVDNEEAWDVFVKRAQTGRLHNFDLVLKQLKDWKIGKYGDWVQDRIRCAMTLHQKLELLRLEGLDGDL